MGFFRWLTYSFLLSGSAVASALSLGPKKLPMVSRQAGRFIGMQFNYVKVLLRVFTPKEGSEEQNMLVSEFRKGT